MYLRFKCLCSFGEVKRSGGQVEAKKKNNAGYSPKFTDLPWMDKGAMAANR